MTSDISSNATFCKFCLHGAISLFQVEQQLWDEERMEQRSIEETNSEESSTKLLIVGNKEYVPTSRASQSPITILSSSEANQNSVDLSLRPPPPLKAAVRSRGQSLLKNSPITMHIHTPSGGGAVSISTAMDESKRTQWKCKRCNYRDTNKDNVLLHVKSHYESADHESIEERVSSVPLNIISYNCIMIKVVTLVWTREIK